MKPLRSPYAIFSFLSFPFFPLLGRHFRYDHVAIARQHFLIQHLHSNCKIAESISDQIKSSSYKISTRSPFLHLEAYLPTYLAQVPSFLSFFLFFLFSKKFHRKKEAFPPNSLGLTSNPILSGFTAILLQTRIPARRGERKERNKQRCGNLRILPLPCPLFFFLSSLAILRGVNSDVARQLLPPQTLALIRAGYRYVYKSSSYKISTHFSFPSPS